MVYAFYTGVKIGSDNTHTLCLATSSDLDLLTWKKPPASPLNHLPPKEFTGCGFRDPYIWQDGQVWKMVIGAGVPNGGETVLLYESSALFHWTYINPLIVSKAQNDKVFECPMFFPLDDKWVLIVSVMEPSQVDFYVGSFENNKVTHETHGTIAKTPFFAPYAFKAKDGRQFFIAWLKEMRPREAHVAAGWARLHGRAASKTSDQAFSMPLPMELLLDDEKNLVLVPTREALVPDIVSVSKTFTNVTVEMLSSIQAEMGQRIKVTFPEDMKKVFLRIALWWNFSPEADTRQLVFMKLKVSKS